MNRAVQSAKQQLSLRTRATSEAICQALAVVIKRQADCETWQIALLRASQPCLLAMTVLAWQKAMQWLKIVLK